MTKEIKWLTYPEIVDAADKSDLAAAECSEEHWQQLVSATRAQLIAAYEAHRVSPRSLYCALCRRHMDDEDGCGKCPVAEKYEPDCDGKFGWLAASLAFEDVIAGKSCFRKWRRASKKVLRQLTEIAEELKKGK